MIDQYLPHLLILAASFFWTTGYIYSNQNNLNQIELLMIRATMIIISSYIYCRYSNQSLDFKNTNLKKLSLRNIFGIIHGFYYAFCQFYIPLHIVHTIGSIGIIFVIILDYLIDSKRVTKQQTFYISLSFIGILIIINRQWLEQIIGTQITTKQSEFQNYRPVSSITEIFISSVLVLVMFLWAIAVKMSQKIDLQGGQMNISYGFTLLIITSLNYFYIETKTDPFIFYPGYLFSGSLLALSQLLFITAILKSKQVGLTLTMGNTCIIFAYLFSVFRYHEQISILCVIGSIITIIGVTKVMINK